MPSTATLPWIAVVGESHADPFIGAYVRADDGMPLAVVPYAHIPALKAAYYLDPQGRIGPRIVTALCALRILYYCVPSDPKTISPAIMGQNQFNPEGGPNWKRNPLLGDVPILFMSGEVDARLVFAAIPPHADVPSAFPPEALANVPGFAATATVSEESLQNVISTTLAPMFRCFTLLRDAGLTSLAMHSISPPTPDDAQYQRELQHDTRILVRTKVIMRFNAMMKSFCEREGFIFIDRWADFTDGGLVRPGYSADAVHVQHEYVRESLALLYERTIGAR